MQQFEAYLQGKGLSPSTIGRYERLASLFTAWYGSDDVINCEKKDILSYLGYLKNKNQQTAARNHSLIALRHYFDYLSSQDLTASNPTALIKLRGVKKRRLHYAYNPEELAELADKYYLLEVKRAKENLKAGAGQQLRKQTYLAKMRNYAMLLFFVHQGLKTIEVLHLQTEDIELHKASVSIGEGTLRGNARTLPLHATQIGALMQYLNEIRPQLANPDDSTLLFLPLQRASNRSAEKADAEASFKRLAGQLKRMDRNFNNIPQLRSSVITHWIKNYGLRKAQYMAGHKSIASTEEYLPNHIEDLAEDMTKYNPF